MAVVAMIVFAVFLGKSPLYPVQVMGALVVGEEGLNGLQASTLLAGLAIHMFASIVWGLIFGVAAMLFSIHSTAKALLFGLILGVVSMIDVYVIVPAALQALGRADIWNREVPMFWDWAAHLVFGASFACFPWAYRRF